MNITPFLISENYVTFYNLLIMTMIALFIALAIFMFYFYKIQANYEYKNIFIEKIMSFLLSISPTLAIPILTVLVRCIYCQNYLTLFELQDTRNSSTLASNMTGANQYLNVSVKCYSQSHLLTLISGIITLSLSSFFGFVYCFYYFNFDNYSPHNKENCYNPQLQKYIMSFKILLIVAVEIEALNLDSSLLFISTLIFCATSLLLNHAITHNYLIHSKGRKIYLTFVILVFVASSLIFLEVILNVFDLGHFHVMFVCFVLIVLLIVFYMIRYKANKLGLLILKKNLFSSPNDTLRKIMFLHKLIIFKKENNAKYNIELFGYLTHHELYCGLEDCPLKLYREKIIQKFKANTPTLTYPDPVSPSSVTKKSKNQKTKSELKKVEEMAHLKANLDETLYSYHSNLPMNIKKADNTRFNDDDNAEESDQDFMERIYQYLVYHQDKMFDMAIRYFPFNFELKFFYIMYLVNIYSNYDKARNKLAELSLETVNQSQKYMTFILQVKIINLQRDQILKLGLEMNRSKNTNEIRNVILFQKLSTKFKGDLEKISINFVDFWSNFTSNSQKLDDIKKSGLSLIGNIKSLYMSWKKLEKYNLANPEILWLYGFFLCDILDERTLGHTYLEKSKETLSSFKVSTINFSFSSALNKGSNTCIAVAKEGEGAVVSRVSLSFSKTFGYSPNELEGKNVNVFLPHIFHSIHNSLILNFSQRTKYDSRKAIKGYALHKTGYIIFTHTNITKVPSYNFDNSFLVRVIQMSYNNYKGCIITDKNMNICYISTEIPKIFEINEKETILLKNSHKLEARDKFNLTEFIQELYISIDDFVQHEKEVEEKRKYLQMSQLKAQILQDENTKVIPKKPSKEKLESECNYMLKRIVNSKLNLFKSEGKFVKADCNLIIGNFNRKTNSSGVIKNEYLKFINEKYINSRLKSKNIYGNFINNLRLGKMMQNSSSNNMIALKTSNPNLLANSIAKSASPSVSPLIQAPNISSNKDVKISLNNDDDQFKNILKGKILLSNLKFGANEFEYYAIEIHLDYNFKKYTFAGEKTIGIKNDLHFKHDIRENRVKVQSKHFHPPEGVYQSAFFPSLGFKDFGTHHEEKEKVSKQAFPRTPTKDILKKKHHLHTISPNKTKPIYLSSASDTRIEAYNNWLNDRKVFNSIFSIYSENVILYKIDLVNNFELKRLVVDEDLNENQILGITQETVMLRDSYDDYEETDYMEGENNKIEVRKSEIFSSTVNVKNTELSFLKSISISIILIHFFFTLANYLLIASNIDQKYNLLKITYNAGYALNYSMGIADSILNCMIIQQDNFAEELLNYMREISPNFEKYQKSDFLDDYLYSIKYNSINLYNTGNVINYQFQNQPSSSFNQTTLIWKVNNLLKDKSQEIVVTNVRFVEGIAEIASTSQVISLSNASSLNFTVNNPNVYFVLYNLLNSLGNIMKDVSLIIADDFDILDSNITQYGILIASTLIILVLVLISFILLIRTIIKINKISIELLCINSYEAQSIVNSSQNFIKLVKQQLEEEDIEFVEEEMISSTESTSKGISKNKHNVSKSNIYSVCSIFIVYFIMMFVHHLEIISGFRLLTDYIKENYNYALELNTFVRDSYFPSIHTKLKYINYDNIFDVMPVNYSTEIKPLFLAMIESYESIIPIISKFNSTDISAVLMKNQSQFHMNRSESTPIENPDFFVFDSVFELAYFNDLEILYSKNILSESSIHILTDAEDTIVPLFSMLIGSYQEMVYNYMDSKMAYLSIWFFVVTVIIVLIFILMWLPSEKYILEDNMNLKMIILLLPNKILRRRPKMISIMKEENLISYSTKN